MESKAFYRIRVLGQIQERWSERLGDMKISVGKETDQNVSTLDGWLRDQASLSGVLNTLYEMHFTVLSVERKEQSCEE